MEITDFVNWGKLLLRADAVGDIMKIDLWISDLRHMPSDAERDSLLSFAIKKRNRNIGQLVSDADRKAILPLARKWNSWADHDRYFEFLEGNISLEEASQSKPFREFHERLREWVGSDDHFALARALFRVMEAVQHHIPAGKRSGKSATSWSAETTIMSLW